MFPENVMDVPSVITRDSACLKSDSIENESPLAVLGILDSEVDSVM